MCEKCDVSCSSRWLFDRHMRTNKHTNVDKMLTSTDNIVHKSIECICGKTYNHRQSLSLHKKKCSVVNQLDEPNSLRHTITPSHSTTEDMKMTLILELVKQNQDFKDLMIEQNKQITELIKINGNTTNNTINNISNNTNTNSHNNNKTFNLQFFLNETCKNAINMSEFIENIEVQMNELENIGHNGYVAGMTDIILSRIKDLDVSKRPVHCTDLKRETMYIKDLSLIHI